MLDLVKGLRSIGEWKQYWWGCRWFLDDDEVRQVKAKIRQEMTIVSAALLLPGSQPEVAVLEGLYWVLSSRLEAANKGRGVIVDCPVDYISATSLGHATMSSGFPLNLNWMKNISNIKSR